MFHNYFNTHPSLRQAAGLERGPANASVVNIQVSNLLTILHRQIMQHDFAGATATMATVSMAMDHVPEVVRKVGIEVLLHNSSAYGDCLQLYKQFFKKRKKIREELLLEMSMYICRHGNLQEAYDTLQSQISSEPMKSNPLIHGYCGMLPYLLWSAELKLLIDKHSSDLSGGSNDDIDDDVMSNPKLKALAKRALKHFSTVEGMELTRSDNINVFVRMHYQLLVAMDTMDEAYQLLVSHHEKFPHQINPLRFICNHLREHSSEDVTARIQYLKLLAGVDESCPEVVELVDLMMTQEGEKDLESTDEELYKVVFVLLVRFLDYPNNGERAEEAWKMLSQVQAKWPDYRTSKLWTTREYWWREIYHEKFKC